MGALVSHHFLTRYIGIDQQWKDMYIHAWVTLSGAWSGGVKTLGQVVSGADLNLFPTSTAQQRQQQKMLLVPIMRTLESIPWILPRHEYYRNTVLVSTPSRNYTAAEYSDLFSRIGYTDGYEVYNYVAQSVTPTFPPAGVRTYCFYGTNVPTPETYVYDQDLNAGNSIGMTQHTLMGDGDGTVNLVSLQVCKQFATSTKEFSDINHQAIIEDSTVLLHVAAVALLPPEFLSIVG